MNLRLASVLCVALLLGGCGDSNFADLDAFMDEKRSRPGGIIAPIPTFQAYDPFAYSAMSLRSPFDRPVEVRDITQLRAISAVKPDENRPKEFLEQFTFDSLGMVGTLSRGGTRWALIRDPQGGVHRVTLGNFLGRNHGKVVELAETHVSIVEIVSDGTENGWVERPRTIELSGI